LTLLNFHSSAHPSIPCLLFYNYFGNLDDFGNGGNLFDELGNGGNLGSAKEEVVPHESNEMIKR
jgi:hypothetical protein